MKKTTSFIITILIAINGYSQPAATSGSFNSNNDTTTYPGDYALVAGGSKGIGYALAKALAKRHYNLILIARHADSLLAAKHNWNRLTLFM